MTLTQKARKAVATGLAISTAMLSISFLALPAAFAAPHNSGCLVNVNGTVYLVDAGQKRGFTSAEVFTSHGYNFGQVVAANSDDASLPTGSIIVYADGTLVKGPSDPLVYLVVNGQKRGFISGSVFTGLGYSFANIQWAPVNTFNDLPTGANIESTSTTGLPMSGPGPKTVNCSTSTTPGLGGSEGEVVSTTETSTEDSSAPEGETSEVFGFEAEIEGDVQIDRVDFYIESDSVASENADDYFDSAILIVDGEEVATMDVDGFDEDDYDVVTADSTDEYRLRFSNLELNFNDGDEPEFILAFETVGTIDSADQASDWTVTTGTDFIRYVDGRGFSDDAGTSLTETFGIDSEDVADLVLSSSTNDPEGAVIEVSDDSVTEGVEVFVFEIEEQNDVDVTINDITLVVTSLTTTDESAVFEDAHLYLGSTLLDSVSVPTGGSLEFEDLDLDIDAEDTEELTLKLDIADADGFTAGTTFSVAVNGNTIDAEDANGNDESDITPTGTATSATHELREEGIMVEFDSATATRSFTADDAGEDDQGTYVINFDVTAFGADAYIDRSAEAAGADAEGQGIEYSITSTAGTPAVSSALVDAEGVVNGDHAVSFKVEEGETRSFSLTLILTADTTPTDGSHQVAMVSINWDTEAGGVDGTPDFFYSFDMGDYKTPYLFLNGM